MPIPKPKTDESKNDFLSRCMGEIAGEFDNNDQAVAVCATAWRDKDKSMNEHERLLAAIKSRSQHGSFNRGILTADHYVKTLEQDIGLAACYKYASVKHTSFTDAMLKATRTLTYNDEGMVLEEVEFEKQPGVDLRKLSDEIELPKNTLMAFRHVLTTPRKDRDGDILRPMGAQVDLKMLLLWQHVHTLPIGKLLAVVSQSEKGIVVVSAIVDINELCHDAAVMVDNGMGRFSHGFRALEFTELKETEGETTGGDGFDVKRFEIMEESLVSVPSNKDAEIQEVILSLVEGGKLTSGIMKQHGAEIRRNRSVQVPVDIDVKVFVNGEEQKNGQANKNRNSGASEKADDESRQAATKAGGEKETPDTKMISGLEGSWQWIDSKLDHSAKAYLTGHGILIPQDAWIHLLATFADHAVVSLSMFDIEPKYYKIAWKMDDGKPQFTGDVQEVEIKQTTELIELQKAMIDRRKAGRTLSNANIAVLKEIHADVSDLLERESDLSRGGKAICERCVIKLSQMIGKDVSPEDDVDLNKPGKEISVSEAAGILIAHATADDRNALRTALDAIDKSEKEALSVRDYRTLIKG